MNVLVDTSVWSSALGARTSNNASVTGELADLIDESRVRIIGPIRQELLSGVRSESQFERLRAYLSAFPDLQLETADFEQATEFFNTCRTHGIQGSNTDFLICAIAHRHELEIFTLDNDFVEFGKHIAVKLYIPRSRGEER